MSSKKTVDGGKGSDDRFSRLATDPRYRLPSKKHNRIAVDKRFGKLFAADDEDFSSGARAKVDKYGRKVDRSEKQGTRGVVGALYREGEDDEEEDKEEEERAERRKGSKSKAENRLAPASDEDSDSQDEQDPDAEIEAELRRVNATFDRARGGGDFGSGDESSSDEESDDEDAALPEDEDDPDAAAAAAVPMGDASARIAIVNLDWDNIRAADIYAVAQSFAAAGDGDIADGIESVAIYPSEFGKARLEREELEGPPRDIFSAARAGPDDEDDDAIRKRLQAGDAGAEFDAAALRRYQLDRLRYHYAVVTCGSAAAARRVYAALDGREYGTTANFFDLRFVPDGVSFEDDAPRDTATALDRSYRPTEFVTDALTHSKVRLTWDADDAGRKEVQKRAFSRAEIDENDLRAYVGGSSSEEEEDGGADGKKEAERAAMRAALGLGAVAERKKGVDPARPVGDMQVTFTSGLSADRGRGGGGGGVFENSPPRDETTRERYVRKEKERKAKRREKMKAKRAGEEGDETGAKDAEDSGSEIGEATREEVADGGNPADDPFDDPFFNDPGVKTKSSKDKIRKADRLAKREAKQAERAQAEEERKRLELLMDDDVGANGGGAGGVRHFDMREIQRAEKLRKKDKKRGGKRDEEVAAAAEADDDLETADPRFAKMFDSHEYAIDPTNPRFQKTHGMQRILEEGRKRRRGGLGEADGGTADEDSARQKKRKAGGGLHDDDTAALLARVKSKAKKAK